jgi:hypothetical protein
MFMGRNSAGVVRVGLMPMRLLALLCALAFLPGTTQAQTTNAGPSAIAIMMTDAGADAGINGRAAMMLRLDGEIDTQRLAAVFETNLLHRWQIAFSTLDDLIAEYQSWQTCPLLPPWLSGTNQRRV